MENHTTPIPQEKACSICGTVKPLADFENDKRRPDGHGPRCKDCIKAKRGSNKEAKQKKAAEFVAKELKEGTKPKSVQGPKTEEPKPKSRLQGKDPYKDKYGVDWSPTNMCDCGHYLHQHNMIQNPDGPGNVLPCWVAGMKDGKADRCQCRNYVHTPKKAAA